MIFLPQNSMGEVGNYDKVTVLEQLAAGSETETGAESETESGTESGTETGAENGTESESGTEQQEADTYQVEIQYLDEKGNSVTSAAPASYKAGETVTLSAPSGEALLADFLQWEIEAPQALKDSLTADALKNPGSFLYNASGDCKDYGKVSLL